MLLDIFVLGVKDVIKYKKEVLMFVALLTTMNILGVVSVYALQGCFKEGKIINEQGYCAAPIEDNIEKKQIDDVADKLESIYKQGGESMFIAWGLEDKYNYQVQVLISSDEIIWCVPEGCVPYDIEETEVLTLEDVEELIKDKNIKEEIHTGIETSERTFFKVVSGRYKHLKNYNLDAVDEIDIIESTYFSPGEVKKGLDKEFLKVFDESYLSVTKYSYSENEELYFILKYVWAYIALQVVFMTCTFSEFIKNVFRKMRREYCIHILHGANISDIVIRNSLFVFVISILNIFIMNYLNCFNKDIGMLAIFTETFAIGIILILVICSVAKRNDFSLEMQGDV